MPYTPIGVDPYIYRKATEGLDEAGRAGLQKDLSTGSGLGATWKKVEGWYDKNIAPHSDEPGLDPGNFQLEGQGQRKRDLLQQADFAAGRQAPQIGQSGFRSAQGGLVGMLQDRAAGRGPSAAQMQLKDAMGRNVSSQQALLATGGAGGARQASMQAGMTGGSLAGQAAQLRANEMTQAQGLLGQVTGQARGQDLQRQGMMSDAELRSRGLNDMQIARMRQMELDNARLGLTGSMGLEGERTRRRGQDLGVPTAGQAGLSAVSSLFGMMRDNAKSTTPGA